MKGCSDDKDVVLFLNDQLMDHKDNVTIKRKNNLINKSSSLSGNNRFLNNNNDKKVDLNEKRNSIINNSKEMKSKVVVQESIESKSFHNDDNNVPSSMTLSNDEMDVDSI